MDMEIKGALKKSGPGARKPGRGARSNASGRYEAEQREPFDDGWGDEDPLPLTRETVVSRDTSRTVIARNTSPDLGFDRSINPYRGCEHGCSYCYARPTHAWLGLSPGLDFETRILAKPDAAALLEKELRRPGYSPKPMALGTNTDPYQPVERRLRITRAVLEVLAAHGHPLTIVTKSALVARDIDILAPMAAQNLAWVAISITTLDSKLARVMEPRAATPARRLETVRALSDAGIPVAVMVAPVIPGLNDHEIESILEAAKKAGAVRATHVLLRLPLELKTLFREWLETAAPERAGRVMSLVRQTRGGKDYDANWRSRQTGTGPVAELIGKRVRNAVRRLGLDTQLPPLDTSRFHLPPRAGDQLALF
jgi:DNA repair photolyase